MRKLSQVAAAMALGLALAACGATSQQLAQPSPAPMGEEFGAGCAAVPTDPANPGSFEAMAKVPTATAASGNPVLSTLVSAVGAAQLGDSLNSAQAITVFAPTNDAFAKIPPDKLQKVLADKAQLTKILTYHVVAGKLSPDQLAGEHKTLEGDSLKVTGGGTDFTVNGTAKVVCGNVQTANGTVYIVDSVLMPPA